VLETPVILLWNLSMRVHSCLSQFVLLSGDCTQSDSALHSFHTPFVSCPCACTQGEGALKEAQLQRRIALVHQVVEALVGQGARHLVLDSLRQQEQKKLQASVARPCF